MPRKRHEPKEATDAEIRQMCENAVAKNKQLADPDFLLTSAVNHAGQVIDRNQCEKTRQKVTEAVGPVPEGSAHLWFKNTRSHDAEHLVYVARRVLDWKQKLLQAMECGDVREIAYVAFKLGAAAERLHILDRIRFADWLTPTEAAQYLSKSQAEVSNLIAAGELKTN